MNKEVKELHEQLNQLTTELTQTQEKLKELLSDKTKVVIYPDSEGNERVLVSGPLLNREGRISQTGKTFTYAFGSKQIPIRNHKGEVIRGVKVMLNMRKGADSSDEEAL